MSRIELEKSRKKIEYGEYINDHCENAYRVWEHLQDYLEDYKVNPTYFIGESAIGEIEKLISDHDYSKGSDEEFNAYRNFFFPMEGEEKDRIGFEYAWNHHQKSNAHHWQYWIMWKIEGSLALEMPFKFVIEMLCDWTAMSYNFKNSPKAFYEREKNNMLLHSKTRGLVEYWLDLFDNLALNHLGLEEWQ